MDIVSSVPLEQKFLKQTNDSPEKKRAICAFQESLIAQLPHASVEKAQTAYYETFSDPQAMPSHIGRNLKTKSFVQLATPTILQMAEVEYDKAYADPSYSSDELTQNDPNIFEKSYPALPSNFQLTDETTHTQSSAIRAYREYLHENVSEDIHRKVWKGLANKEITKELQNSMLTCLVFYSTSQQLKEAEKIYQEKMEHPSDFAKSSDNFVRLVEEDRKSSKKFLKQLDKSDKKLETLSGIAGRMSHGIYSSEDRKTIKRLQGKTEPPTSSREGAIVGVIMLATVFGGGATLVIAAIAWLFFGLIAGLISGAIAAVGTIALTKCIIKKL